MSRIITLTGGQQVALENIDINIPEPFVDLFGRLRTSSPETQVQIQQDTTIKRALTLSHGFITPNAQMSGAAINNYFDITSTGTGGFYRARSKICGLYQNGKSLLVFFTFNFVTTGTTGVIKRVGYCHGTNKNGIWLEQNGDQVSWRLGSTVTNTELVSTQDSWINNITLDWTKAQIGFVAFEYLGVGDILCGFVQDRTIIGANVFSNKNNLTVPYMATPNLYLTYEMQVSRATTNLETLRIICSTCLIEGGQERRGFPFILKRFTGFNLTTNVPNAVFVFRSTSPTSRILIGDFETAFGTNATIIMELVKLTSVGNLPASGGIVNGVEQWIPTNGNVTFTGESLTGTLTTQTTRQSKGNLLVDQYLETNFDDTGVYYAIVVTTNTNNTTLQACLINFILES